MSSQYLVPLSSAPQKLPYAQRNIKQKLMELVDTLCDAARNKCLQKAVYARSRFLKSEAFKTHLRFRGPRDIIGWFQAIPHVPDSHGESAMAIALKNKDVKMVHFLRSCVLDEHKLYAMNICLVDYYPYSTMPKPPPPVNTYARHTRTPNPPRLSSRPALADVRFKLPRACSASTSALLNELDGNDYYKYECESPETSPLSAAGLEEDDNDVPNDWSEYSEDEESHDVWEHDWVSDDEGGHSTVFFDGSVATPAPSGSWASRVARMISNASKPVASPQPPPTKPSSPTSVHTPAVALLQPAVANTTERAIGNKMDAHSKDSDSDSGSERVAESLSKNVTPPSCPVPSEQLDSLVCDSLALPRHERRAVPWSAVQPNRQLHSSVARKPKEKPPSAVSVASLLKQLGADSDSGDYSDGSDDEWPAAAALAPDTLWRAPVFGEDVWMHDWHSDGESAPAEQSVYFWQQDWDSDNENANETPLSTASGTEMPTYGTFDNSSHNPTPLPAATSAASSWASLVKHGKVRCETEQADRPNCQPVEAEITAPAPAVVDPLPSHPAPISSAEEAVVPTVPAASAPLPSKRSARRRARARKASVSVDKALPLSGEGVRRLSLEDDDAGLLCAANAASLVCVQPRAAAAAVWEQDWVSDGDGDAWQADWASDAEADTNNSTAPTLVDVGAQPYLRAVTRAANTCTATPFAATAHAEPSSVSRSDAASVDDCASLLEALLADLTLPADGSAKERKPRASPAAPTATAAAEPSAATPVTCTPAPSQVSAAPEPAPGHGRRGRRRHARRASPDLCFAARKFSAPAFPRGKHVDCASMITAVVGEHVRDGDGDDNDDCSEAPSRLLLANMFSEEVSRRSCKQTKASWLRVQPRPTATNDDELWEPDWNSDNDDDNNTQVNSIASNATTPLAGKPWLAAVLAPANSTKPPIGTSTDVAANDNITIDSLATANNTANNSTNNSSSTNSDSANTSALNNSSTNPDATNADTNADGSHSSNEERALEKMHQLERLIAAMFQLHADSQTTLSRVERIVANLCPPPSHTQASLPHPPATSVPTDLPAADAAPPAAPAPAPSESADAADAAPPAPAPSESTDAAAADANGSPAQTRTTDAAAADVSRDTAGRPSQPCGEAVLGKPEENAHELLRSLSRAALPELGELGEEDGFVLLDAANRGGGDVDECDDDVNRRCCDEDSFIDSDSDVESARSLSPFWNVVEEVVHITPCDSDDSDGVESERSLSPFADVDVDGVPEEDGELVSVQDEAEREAQNTVETGVGEFDLL